MTEERLLKIKEGLLKLDELYSQQNRINQQIKIMEQLLELLYIEEKEERIKEKNREFLSP